MEIPIRGPEETDQTHPGVKFSQTRRGKRPATPFACCYARLNTGVSANWAYISTKRRSGGISPKIEDLRTGKLLVADRKSFGVRAKIWRTVDVDV